MPLAVGHFYNEEGVLGSEMTFRPTIVSQSKIKLVPLHPNIHSFNNIPPLNYFSAHLDESASY